MDYWIHTAGVAFEDLVELAERAEELGFAGLLFSEHFVEPPPPEATRGLYPYNEDGLQGGIAYPDPWVVAGRLAASTHRLRFATAVAVLPLHETFTLARAVATASLVTGGRVSLGVGAGWWAEEFVALGRDFDGRGRRTDAMIEDLSTLWRGGEVTVDGVDRPLRLVDPLPGPVPILVGGHSAVARGRAVRCDGWLGAAGFLGIDELCAVAARLREERLRSRPDAGTFEIIDRPSGRLRPEDTRRLAEAGLTGLIAFAGRRWRDRIEAFAAQMLPDGSGAGGHTAG